MVVIGESVTIHLFGVAHDGHDTQCEVPVMNKIKIEFFFREYKM